MTSPKRCPWVPAQDQPYIDYHDREWGVPVHDDRVIFEFLVLEAFQAGLSWRTILHRRDHFRRAFAGFDPKKVSRFNTADKARLLKNSGIIRHRGKIEAAIMNARHFLEIQKAFGSFDAYMWSWVKGKPLVNKNRTMKDFKPYNDIALAWAKDLKKRGFKFLGPTILYAHMQAVGMVNDHTVDCFRYRLTPRK